MYCSTCGTLINTELNYCNRCGSSTKNESTKHNVAVVSGLKIISFSTGWVGVVGLGGLIALVGILFSNQVPLEWIVTLSALFLITTFGICFLMTRQISRLTEVLNSGEQHSQQKSPPGQLNSHVVAQIESPRESFISTTENTTHNLEKIPLKAK